MRKIGSFVLGLLVILTFVTSIVQGEERDFCPVNSTGEDAVLDPAAKPIDSPPSDLSVPRNQVLLETFTGTW